VEEDRRAKNKVDSMGITQGDPDFMLTLSCPQFRAQKMHLSNKEKARHKRVYSRALLAGAGK